MRSGVRQSESGSILILTTMMMTMLLGFTALVIDGSHMYEQRNRLAAAADAAAKAAAQELARHSSVSLPTLQTFAEHEVSLHGFTPGGGMSVVVNHPPSSGAFAPPNANSSSYVEIIASNQTPTYFARLLGFVSLTPAARAVAGAGSGPACIVALGSTPTETGAGGFAINVGAGPAVLGVPGCPVVANENMHINNGGSVTATPVSLAGTCSGPTCPVGVNQNQPIVPDPLASLAVPSNPGLPCSPLILGNGVTGSATMPVGGWQCYTKITTGGASNLTLPAGNYYVTGDITLGNGSTTTGAGVFIFLTGTASGFVLGGAPATATLSAATSGPYAGIVFFQDQGDHTTAAFGNGSTFNFSGALYLPKADLSFGGGGQAGASTDCAIIVARKVTFNNGTTFKNGCAAFGGSVLMSATAIAE